MRNKHIDCKTRSYRELLALPVLLCGVDPEKRGVDGGSDDPRNPKRRDRTSTTLIWQR
jgi:hypothetical protein